MIQPSILPYSELIEVSTSLGRAQPLSTEATAMNWPLLFKMRAKSPAHALRHLYRRPRREQTIYRNQFRFGNPVQADGILDSELAGPRPAQRGQMRAASGLPSKIVHEASDVSARGTDHYKFCERRIEAEQFELRYLDLHRRHFDRSIRPRKIIRSHTSDFLGGKRWRNLVENPGQGLHHSANVVLGSIERHFGTCRKSLPVVSICRKPEPDFARVFLRRTRKELCKPRGFADTNWKDTGR